MFCNCVKIDWYSEGATVGKYLPKFSGWWFFGYRVRFWRALIGWRGLTGALLFPSVISTISPLKRKNRKKLKKSNFPTLLMRHKPWYLEKKHIRERIPPGKGKAEKMENRKGIQTVAKKELFVKALFDYDANLDSGLPSKGLRYILIKINPLKRSRKSV